MPDKPIHFINLRILELFKEHRKTHQDLARYLGTATSLDISRRLTSNKSFKFEELKKIAGFFGINFMELVGDSFGHLRDFRIPEAVPENLLSELQSALRINFYPLQDFRNYTRQVEDVKELLKDINRNLN